jgi:hypothetical protein
MGRGIGQSIFFADWDWGALHSATDDRRGAEYLYAIFGDVQRSHAMMFSRMSCYTHDHDAPVRQQNVEQTNIRSVTMADLSTSRI